MKGTAGKADGTPERWSGGAATGLTTCGTTTAILKRGWFRRTSGARDRRCQKFLTGSQRGPKLPGARHARACALWLPPLKWVTSWASLSAASASIVRCHSSSTRFWFQQAPRCKLTPSGVSTTCGTGSWWAIALRPTFEVMTQSWPRRGCRCSALLVPRRFFE